MPVDTRLFCVSEALPVEAEAVFYSVNTFRIMIFQRGHASLPESIDEASPTLGLLRRLHVIVFAIEPASFAIMRHILQLLYRSLERCKKLQELKITVITNIRFTDTSHSMYDENIHGEFDKLLEPFADVRGLGEVFFTGKPWLREWCGMEGCYPVGIA